MAGEYNSLNQELPSNSKGSNSVKHVEKSVATAKGKVKQNAGKKLLRAFFAEDVKSVKSYILTEVVLPELKKLFYDIIINGSHRMIFGKDGSAPVNTNAGFTPYSSISGAKRGILNTGVTSVRTSNYSVYDYNNIFFDTKEQAVAVKNELIKLYKRYNHVTVGDLFDLSECDTVNTDYSYGWTHDISATPIIPYGSGYIIDLPKASPIV